ncbi:unnamed protein product [Schistosoma turkestanicum]|nr:unnamed protein product [Schistosoma turkestanicum]
MEVMFVNTIHETITVTYKLFSILIPKAGLLFEQIWDSELAMKANELGAKLCTNNHSNLDMRNTMQRKCVHQNVIVSNDDYSIAVLSWMMESQYYNIETNRCNVVNGCENFQNMILPGTVYLGCGIHYCPQLSTTEKQLIVCNYSPE